MDAAVTREIDLDALVTFLREHPVGERIIVGIAGPPGSGKSTIAQALVTGINQIEPDRAALLPMDGFHFDDGLLNELGRLARKGAFDTFDVVGLRHILSRLRENTADNVVVPVFDRRIEIARAGARLIPKTTDVVIAEGNYLLLDEHPWSSLAQYFDFTVMIDTKPDVLRTRLMQRWDELGMPNADAHTKVEENDLPNGLFVKANSRLAHFVLNT